MIALAALFLAAAQADPPPDPRCPRGDLQTPRPPGTVCLGRLTRSYAFAFLYSAEAAREPALARLLRAEARRSEAWIARRGPDWLRERAEDGGALHPLSYEEGWEVDAATPQLLAASATIMHYTGGAHGGIEFRAMLLDRRSGRRIALGDLFADRARGLALVQQAFCRALTAAVGERRGEGERRPDCPNVTEQPVSLAAENGRITAFYAMLGPYVVGSYAEGPYEFSIPVGAGMIGLIKPRYRAAFN
ncbi:MAG TPA: hypothetical protein VGW40_12580 [Allosphingosinicella sp.]|nr:hypothetical protein [Allosphingosinicella sp.]